MAYRHKVVGVKTQETAWRLVEYLQGQLPDLRFMVVLPNPTRIEVWPAVGSPLMVADWTEVDNLVERFKRGSTPAAPVVTKVS
jgi:hypothetical protein